MMKGIALIAILSMPSLPAHADTWLCIAEKVAFLRSKDGQIVGGGYEPYDQKYLVSEAGFRYFDIDDYRLDECTFYDGKPTWCESSTDLWSGEYMIAVDGEAALQFGLSSGEKKYVAMDSGQPRDPEGGFFKNTYALKWIMKLKLMSARHAEALMRNMRWKK